MPGDSLYFIALLPPADLRADIEALKEEMHRRFGARHALKAPAHLTLQMPFKRSPDQEAALTSGLAEFAANEARFTVELNGFGCFPPRVIFIKVAHHEPVVGLFERLREHLLGPMGFAAAAVSKRFHPHLTIATRDLARPAFKTAWAEFKSREFQATFEADSLCLLKHNGRAWDIHEAFGFGRASVSASPGSPR